MKKAFLAILALQVLLMQACIQQENVDMIIHNARVNTIDQSMNTHEALAVKGGRIIAVGAEHEILNRYVAENTYDVKGGIIFPGFIDAHSHLLGYGLELKRLNLVGTKSFDEVIDRIKTYTESTDSEWVLGRGWDQNDWVNKVFPNNDTLSKLFPNHYIALKRVDGHAYFASQNVLEKASISPHTQVDGGQIVLDQNGNPTGVVIDEAMGLITEILPQIDENVKRSALSLAQNNVVEKGLTSVCDAGLSIEDIKLINRMHQSDLKIRVYAMYSASKSLFKDMASNFIQTDRLTARSVKLYADGALGSRGAFLLEPYTDDSLNQGLLITPADSIYKWAQKCYQNGFQLNIHCIGDGANRIALEEMGKVLKGGNDLRWRIEHAQVVSYEDRSKFSQFTIIPSMQPTHATSDMYWAKERLGSERIETAYALKSLMNENGLIALGTDFPVESIDPIKTIYAACIRRDENGYPTEGFSIKDKLSREDAIKGVTIWPAIANFEEENRGSIEVGKFADLVLVNRDLLNCTENELLNAEVQKTWINGELVYDKK
ncbi:MAG: amidohydrolase [Salibacteraceae bacterium]